MPIIGSVLTSVCTALLFLAVWKLGAFVLGLYTSPLRNLPGPPKSSVVVGHVRELYGNDADETHQLWMETYGSTFRFKKWFSQDVLYTVDPRAINHILSHSASYQKPSSVRFFLGQLLGNGLIVVEGEQHRVQRRIMNPAFGPAQIRELTAIFIDKAMQLRDRWSSEIALQGRHASIDVTIGMAQMTLDIIGLAGFNIQLNALNVEGEPNELNKAIHEVVQTTTRIPILQIIKIMIPALAFIPDERRKKKTAALAVMNRIGLQLIAEKKAHLMKTSSSKEKEDDDHLQGRDLLSLLIKANMSTDIPENQRLSDEDVLAQVPTFLVAGHETTSMAVTWCLYALTQAPDVQRKLRDELLGVPMDSPSMDELNALPYLDAVVRETMRLYAPVPETERVAVQDDVIPLSMPYTDANGQIHDAVRIKKGNGVLVPILAIHQSKAVWGEDALEFKPERWTSIPDAAHNTPGVWASLMTFIGGPRACIGYRFSLAEMKAVLFTLVRAFEFELAIPASEIGATRGTVVQRPYLRSTREMQMPMIVRPYEQI